jgi:N-acetyl-anhydromuramyl-L-alanine amidase AmpD
MTMTLPTAATASNYKLLPAKKYYPTRNKPVLGIVLHITAGLQDLGLDGTDESAEGTIKWALSREPEVSWHAGADTDGVELCVPDWYTAWHAKGVNSATVGLEISKLNVDWDVGQNGITQEWVDKTLRNAARYLAAIVKKHGIPLTLVTDKYVVDKAIAANRKFGFVYHSTTSAGTRSDPGKNFPIGKLFAYIKAELATPAPAPKPVPYPGHQHANSTKDDSHVGIIQARLKKLGYYKGKVDNSFGPATEAAVKSFQSRNRLERDGWVGRKTWDALKITR